MEPVIVKTSEGCSLMMKVSDELGELVIAALEFRRHNPDGYHQALTAVRVAFAAEGSA